MTVRLPDNENMVVLEEKSYHRGFFHALLERGGQVALHSFYLRILPFNEFVKVQLGAMRKGTTFKGQLYTTPLNRPKKEKQMKIKIESTKTGEVEL